MRTKTNVALFNLSNLAREGSSSQFHLPMIKNKIAEAICTRIAKQHNTITTFCTPIDV
eukprot:11471.XXX_471033_471206_1 [CDS] Oithona nana genome sequencing.